MSGVAAAPDPAGTDGPGTDGHDGKAQRNEGRLDRPPPVADFRLTSAARIGLLVILALLPVFLGTGYALSRVRGLLEHDTVERATERLGAVLEAEKRLAEEVSTVALAVSVDAADAAETPASCSALTDRFRSTPAGPLSILILDQTGTVRCATRPALIGTERALPAEAENALRSGHIVVGELDQGPFSQGATLQVAAPWSAPNSARGAVLLSFRPDLPALFGGIGALTPSETIVLANRAGQILYAGPSASSEAPVALPADIDPRLWHGADRVQRVRWFDGTKRVVATAMPAGAIPGLLAAVGVRDSAGLEKLNRLARTLTLGLLAEVLLITALVLFGAHYYVTRPIRRLMAAVSSWRQGNRMDRISLFGSGDIAALGSVFNELVDALERGDQKARESAYLLHALIESSADAIFVKDLDGRLVLVNSTFARLFGRSREALLGTRDADLVDAPTAALLQECEQALLQSGKIQVRDVVFRPVASDMVFQTIYAPIMSPGGEIVALAAIARDVTQERAVADMLRQAKARAELADKSKTRFLAAASHDLRQPVQAAMLHSDMLVSQVSGKPAEQARELRRVLGNMKLMLDLLLDVSRLDTNSVRPVLADFDLKTLVEETLASAQADAAAKGLALRAEDTQAWVRSDRAMLARILNNLVSNAVRYTEAGEVTIGFVQNPGQIAIEVRDTGIGIPPQDIARIWQEFEQLGNPSRDSSAGLGLGLSIVQRLARLLDLQVSVQSELGKGSCFRIVVPSVAPASAGNEEREPPIHTTAPDRGQLAVLIEDNPMLLELFTIVLEQEGWTVLGAADHRDLAPGIAEAHESPAIIVTDYRLRDGFTGADAIASIREAAGRQIPAIIITGEVLASGPFEGGPLVDAERLGRVAVLHKPVETNDLIGAMKRMVSTREEV